MSVEETFSGNYVVVFDPLDGSSNIDAGIATGAPHQYPTITSSFRKSYWICTRLILSCAAPEILWCRRIVAGFSGRVDASQPRQPEGASSRLHD